MDHLLPSNSEDDAMIRIRDLKVWTPEEKSWFRRKVTKPRTVILNNISGSISNGEFIAVIGPSGAGKTTFLVSLAGKCTLPAEGKVTIRGRNVRSSRGVELTPQLDVFMESLTVLEHLIFMIEMKLGCSKKIVHRDLLRELMFELKLTKHAHTHIRNLSGGERRLLSLAGSLLSGPEILICDEPTTGLDSYNAALVIGVLKKIALSGKIVICSVHQPSSDLFKEFSSVMLMAEGNLLFHGTLEECRDVFESMNLHCPKNYNAAEFYIRAVSNSSSESCSHRLMEISRERSKAHTINRTGFREPTKSFNVCRRNWFKQVQLLIWRASLTVTREIKDFIFQLFVCLGISAIVLATCYSGISGTTQRGVQDLRGFLWLVCSEVLFSLSYNALYMFERQLTLFRREVGVYSSSAYFVARFLCLVPRIVIWPVSLVFMATLAVDLPNYILTSLEFMLALIVASFAATAYGLGMGALFTSTGVMGDVMPCTDLPLFLMSGAFLRVSSLPAWLQPLKFFSHFYYAMDALSNVYWRQISYIDCPSNSTSNCVKDGIAVLIENGYSKDFILLDSLGLTIVTFLWCILAYYGLKREEKKGFAY